jgi:hypothetical protein
MSASEILVLGGSYIFGAVGMGIIRKMDLWMLIFACAHLAALTILAAALEAWS